MKKIGLMILSCMILCSCAQKNEEEAVLNVAVHNEEYGNKLNELWKELYPEEEIVISVVSEEEIETKITQKQDLSYDVYWIEDSYVPWVIEGLIEVSDDVEVEVNTNFNEVFKSINEAYLPIMATSDTYYALDLNKIESDQISEEAFSTFEELSKLDNSFYYLDHIYFTKHFLTSNINYFPGKEKTILNFNSESFIESLTNYQSILNLIKNEDTNLYDNWFINNTHYSGFIMTNMQLDADEKVNGGKYKITKLPTIDGKQLYTQATSYGYVINGKTQYPNAARNLVELMHSEKGMQILCELDDFVPLIPEDRMNEFTFVSEHLKEKTYALNYAIAKCFIRGNDENSALDYLYLESTIEKLNNCDLENIEACQLELDKEYQEWVK